MSEITEQEVRESFEVIRRFGDNTTDEYHHAEAAIIFWAEEQLARIESERAELGKPIDAEWCLANGARHWEAGDEYVFECGIRWAVPHGESGEIAGGVYLDHRGSDRWRHVTKVPEIKTRGQLAYLLKAIKGIVQ